MKTDMDVPITLTDGRAACISGEVTLIADGDHLDRVVKQGICKAKVSVDIATADFKAMLVPQVGQSVAPSIVEIFRQLADSGVEIRLMHSGVPTSPVLAQLRRALPRGIVIRRCPRLHAKAVIIDSSAMYLGSANLTGAGLGAKSERRRNFEWGVWTESADLIDAVHGRFNQLWEGEHCEGCGRKNICPVPLEEPHL